MRAVNRFAKRFARRFAVAALVFAALVPALASARADEPKGRACLNQRERRAVIENGAVIRLAAAIHAAKGRLPGTVVRARLCHVPEGLAYVLTVLAHNGKVTRVTVDAVKGTLVGGL
jgi:uncharacterized membrane protein YkoI